MVVAGLLGILRDGDPGPSRDQVLAAEQVVWKLEDLARVIRTETDVAR